jgi:arylsulfatase A-like enzyme
LGSRSSHHLCSRVRLAIALLILLAPMACRQGHRPNIVLITLDTTRADHLGPYGYTRARTPNLDRFAAGAIVYELAYATSSWTLPSHASIFTGLLPMEHGAQAAPGDPVGQLDYGVRPLSERFTTLAECFREAGYRTGGVVGGPALGRELGVSQGFDIYVDELKGPKETFLGKRAEEVANRAIEIVQQFGPDPFFLFVNFFDPHAPYRPPPPDDRGVPDISESPLPRDLITRLLSHEPAKPVSEFADWERQAIADMITGYDAEIAYMDRHLGRLIDTLEAASRAHETLIAITSDHGDSFGENYYVSHGAHLYEHNIRVPLMLRLPGGERAGTRVSAPVQNHRLFATLLRAAGIEVPAGIVASDLSAPGTPIVTEVRRSDLNIRMFGPFFDRDLRAIYDPPYKLITSSTGEVELFDLGKAAGEYQNLVDRRPDISQSLQARLERISEAHPSLYDAEERVTLTPETEKAMRALGYIE